MTSAPDNKQQAEVRLWLRKQVSFLVILGIILFASAGTFDWLPGWLQWITYALVVAFQAIVMAPRRPGLYAERARMQAGTPVWDVLLASLGAIILPIATWVVGGLDYRWGWSPDMPLWLVFIAIILWLASYGITLWAMWNNPFFAATVRIQTERDHHVISGGPYQVVRHPGYVGACLFQICTPFVLGSWWALVPSLLTVAVYVVRTALEDAKLQSELSGYHDYAKTVRYRLFPGIW